MGHLPWKYVNPRRHFVYVEPSIDHGTQRVVLEPNRDPLWDNIRLMAQGFSIERVAE